ncbi:MAG: NADH:flavin oxidoreductase/NADH oxidase [Burkholderiales bacterium]|nr:NADH:flavin oxidoreductase/NADH oxidase [Burkholderiales bacterium]
MTILFEPFALRGVTLRHRLVVPPMCQYSAVEGIANEWHFANYARFAMGGAAMVIVEATAIDPRGRVSPGDLGLWRDEQIAPMRSITAFLAAQGCVPAIQLNHGGRKASCRRPWHGSAPLDDDDMQVRNEPGWPVVAPSAVPAGDKSPMPVALDLEGVQALVGEWASAARRALQAGYEAVEIHAAHGYLLHQFLSPLSNHRTDCYGGSREGRMRLTLEIAEAVRAVWPHDKPVLARVSAVDGIDGGWSLDDTVVLARALKERGVDAIHCSSGGLVGAATMSRLARTPGFQVSFAERIRREAGIPTIAVGLILTPRQAADIVDNGQADLVAIGREALLDPNWPHHARLELQPERGFDDWPPQSGWWLERRAAILRSES